MGNVGKIQIVPVREAFKHEAHNFTVWLSENIEALAERIGLRLTVIAREQQVGDFKLDILCEDGEGNRVIVENQLERTDHDHLGKLLTYLVNLDAKTAIWVTPNPRTEHERVIDWLNEKTEIGLAFYLVKVEAIRIGDSPYAPLFTAIKQPDQQVKAIGESKKEFASQETAETTQLYINFWTRLLERSKGRTKLFSGKKPSTRHWIGTGAGKTGIVYNYAIIRKGALIDVYIDTGDGAANKDIFDTLLEHKDAIESAFGEPLDWRRLNEQRASRIVKVFNVGGLHQPETWDNLQDDMIAKMIKLDHTFRPYIDALK